MEALTDILRAMRLSGGVFLDAAFTDPWCIVSQVAPEDCLPYMPVPDQLVAYHLVVEGTLVAHVDGAPPLVAKSGQLLVLPRNDRHILGSRSGLPPADANALIEPGADGEPARIRYGGGGHRSSILCGYLGTNDNSNPLLMSLPALLHLDLRAKSTGPWIEGSIRHAMQTLTNGGSSAAASLSRLAELLFTEAVREYVSTLTGEQTTWLSGLRDPVVARTLALIHSHTDDPWSLASMSKSVGSSRSVVSERFRCAIGVGPMQYLRRRRLAQAAERLSHSSKPVAAIALAAGYETEAAFSRAFKREFGSAPSTFRAATRRT